MVNESYVAKFGESLRRLAALDAGMSGQGPVLPAGPAPVTGAFELSSGLSPKDDQTMAAPAFQQAQEPAPAPMPEGAFGTAEKAAAPPVSASQMIENLSDEEQKEVAAGLKERTGKTVDELYDEMVKSGEIAPPAKKIPSAKEKLPRLAEALLRFAAHMGRGADGGEASALATLETGQRRGAMEQAEIERQRVEETQRRGEVSGVLSARKARTEKQEDTDSERKYKNEDREDAQRHALELQKAQDAAAALREKGKNVQVFTDAQGNVVMIDKDTNKVIPLEVEAEEEVVVAQGQRGKPALTEKRKVKRPLKGQPRPDGTSTIDPDTELRQIGDEKERLAEDRAAKREAQAMVDAGEANSLDEAYEKMARQNVRGRTGGGSTAADSVDPLGWKK